MQSLLWSPAVCELVGHTKHLSLQKQEWQQQAGQAQQSTGSMAVTACEADQEKVVLLCSEMVRWCLKCHEIQVDISLDQTA